MIIYTFIDLQIFIDFIVEIIPDEIENLHTDIQN